MKTLLAVLVIAVIVLAVITKLTKGAGATEKPRRRQLLTNREQAMFNRLHGALPTVHISTQVSFGALLTAKSRASRNTFDRKIADFVLCDQAHQVIAVIELDDASHRSKSSADQARDKLLKNAGYRVLRYANVPDIDQVQRDVFPPPPTDQRIAT